MKYMLNITALLAALFGVYLISLHDFLLFHSVAEGFCIVIACGIFMIAWNARRFLQNHYLLFIGIAYLFVGSLDYLHTLAYEGMGVFKGSGADLPTQLWIAGRYVEALSLCVGTIFLHRKLSPRLVFLAYGLSTGLLLAAIFYWKVFPVCFTEGGGLTPFKIYSEYMICLILFGAIGLLIRHSKDFDRKVLILLIAAIGTTIAQELAFTTYLSVYGPSNMVGHLLKIVSFYLVYKAIVETSLVSPWNLLFRDLKQSEVRYRSLFDNMTEGFALHEILTDVQGRPVDYRFLEVNPAFEQLTGLKRTDLLGRTVMEVLPGTEDSWIENYGRVALSGEPTHFESYSGALGRWYEVFAYQPLLRQFAVVFTDITRRKRMEDELRRSHDDLENRVRERTAELELTNKELQDFAFVASHDLQEPLRKIRIFGDMLASKGGAFSDEASRDYLTRMQKAAARMQNLLNSLLAYSRLTTKAEPLERTDLGKSVEAALSNLEIMIREKNARIEVGDLPSVRADRVQMVQLFQNLIGNALKFSREEEAPHVKIYAQRVHNANEVWEICVEDNGIGFEERYLDKVFLPFQRLHGRGSDYEGVGMGLAICKKIVERHGGEITARSEFGKGSTFVVTLPEGKRI